MPYKNKEAGISTYEMARKRRRAMLVIALIGVLIFILLLFTLNNTKALGIGGIGFIAILFLVQIFPDVLDSILGKKAKEARRAVRGADAEVRIDYLLGNLSEDFYILNDLASPFGNIDHVAVRKDCFVFLIETKSHHGRVSVKENSIYINDRLPEKDFIRQTLKNAYWLRERIAEITGVKAWISPIIVFTNAFVPYTNPVKGVRITNKKFLLDTINKTPERNPHDNTLWEKQNEILSKLL